MSSANGTLLVTLSPYGCVYGALSTASTFNYPWFATSTSATNTPYSNGATILPPPFVAQQGNISAGYIDHSVMRFNSTLSPNNCSGAVVSTVFY
jgi:hypothetical protein